MNEVIRLQSVVCARAVANVQTAIRVSALSVERGTVTILSGRPGCGKNLLLRVLGLLEAPDSGEVWFEGAAVSALPDDARAALRNKRCGYVFSSPFLLPGFSVIENVAMPLFKICEMEPDQARERADEVLSFTSLQDLATGSPTTPAQQHRVALARALAGHPAALFVEELDSLMPESDLHEFRALLQSAAERFHLAVVCTASENCITAKSERRVIINEGMIL